jgi:hypothetical protein
MNRFILFKLHGSVVLGQMICEALNPFIGDSAPEAIGTNGMMIFMFESEHTPDKIKQALDEMKLRGFFLTNVMYTDTDSIMSEMMRMQREGDDPERGMVELTPEDELRIALEDEDYEKAAEIRDKMKKS